MLPGRMDRRIELFARSVDKDAHHEPIDTYRSRGVVWAEVKPVSGGEKWLAAQRLAEVTTVFRIWWQDGLDATHQVRYDGRDYDIVQVLELGRREGLELRGVARAD